MNSRVLFQVTVPLKWTLPKPKEEKKEEKREGETNGVLSLFQQGTSRLQTTLNPPLL